MISGTPGECFFVLELIGTATILFTICPDRSMKKMGMNAIFAEASIPVQHF